MTIKVTFEYEIPEEMEGLVRGKDPAEVARGYFIDKLNNDQELENEVVLIESELSD